MPVQESFPPERFDEFHLVRKLGEGAMGQVFLCRDLTLHRPVAVKFLKVAATSKIERERCLTEARAIARLTHANVVTVYRVGETQGVPYIASEFIEGTSLDEVQLPLPFERVLPIAVSLARGMAAAHERGVLHRDLKPANVMITKSSEVKLLDFGVAKLLEDAPTTEGSAAALPLPADVSGVAAGSPADGPSGARELAVSRSLGTTAGGSSSVLQPAAGAWRPSVKDSASSTLSSTSPVKMQDSAGAARVSTPDTGFAVIASGPTESNKRTAQGLHRGSTCRVGTPLYMSPEAWRGEAISPRSDIYSLGAVLYELSSGSPPHDAINVEQLHVAATTRDALPLRSAAPDVPPWFAAIVDRCLKRDPKARFASGAELLKALESPPRVADAVGLPPAEVSPPSPKHRRLLTLCATGSVMLTVGLFFYLSRPVSGMVSFPGGTFVMGASRDEIAAAQLWCKELLGAECDEVVQQAFKREEPQRQVVLSPFRIDRREVTTEEFVDWLNSLKGIEIEGDRYVKQKGVLLADIYPTYQPFAGYTYDKQRHRFAVPPEYRRRPATQLSWEAASRYCAAWHKRLPTEAEWELAARGTEGRRFPWGYAEPSCERSVIARLPGMPCAKEGIGPKDVASTQSDRTPEGVYDLGGNVSEWVLDEFREQYPSCPPPCKDPAVLPEQVQPSAARVVRGGNWEWAPVTARGTTRSRYAPDRTPKNFGFRCAEPLTEPVLPAKAE